VVRPAHGVGYGENPRVRIASGVQAARDLVHVVGEVPGEPANGGKLGRQSGRGGAMRGSCSGEGTPDEVALHADVGSGCSGSDRVVLGVSELDLDGALTTAFDAVATR
jgi:hypothetical protein